MLNSTTIAILSILIALSSSQQCNPDVIEWFPHQQNCSKFILCFHGNKIEKSCAPNLHFNSEILKCDFPENVQCNLCPLEDDINNPVFYPDRNDCQKYFICFNGRPILRSCANALWWDAEREWCTVQDEVTCDDRVTNNPQLPTTTESLPTVPTQPPNLSTCNHIRYLSDSENGAYLKSICTLPVALTPEQSEIRCRDNRMELFVIDNSAVQKALFKVTTELHNNRDGMWWINGRRDSNGEWFSFSPEREPIYHGIDWVQTQTVEGPNSGDCLAYTMHHGPYQAMGFDCNRNGVGICQFSF